MSRISNVTCGVVFVFLAIVMGSAVAQEFEISRSTVEGGGVMRSTGGDFDLSGTIGRRRRSNSWSNCTDPGTSPNRTKATTLRPPSGVRNCRRS